MKKLASRNSFSIESRKVRINRNFWREGNPCCSIYGQAVVITLLYLQSFCV